MVPLLYALEKEKRKLSEMGLRSFEQGIPLYQNSALQTQSKKVDQLIVQLYAKGRSAQH